MKIAVIDHYNHTSSSHKDPISIPRGLASRGHDIKLVTLDSCEVESLFGFQLIGLDSWLGQDLEISPPDLVIAITRFDPGLTPMLRTIKESQIPLIVKGDTDGSLGYPLVPNYLRSRPVLAHPLNVFRHIKWRIPVKKFVMQKLEHIKLADLIVCESPGAAENINIVLDYWGLSEQVRKIAFIPNAISDVCTRMSISEKRPDTVVSVGRWDDRWCKGSDLLAVVISRTLIQQPDIQFIVIGNNSEVIKKMLSGSMRAKVDFTGPLDFQNAQTLISSSEILLAPSRLESFSLVAGEALCNGSSLVATPIESLIYLAGDGNYGSIARDFSAEAISTALFVELARWREGKRSVKNIASHWRETLAEDAVTSQWVNALQRIQ